MSRMKKSIRRITTRRMRTFLRRRTKARWMTTSRGRMTAKRMTARMNYDGKDKDDYDEEDDKRYSCTLFVPTLYCTVLCTVH